MSYVGFLISSFVASDDNIVAVSLLFVVVVFVVVDDGNTNTLSHSHVDANLEHSSGDNHHQSFGCRCRRGVVVPNVVVVDSEGDVSIILNMVTGLPPRLDGGGCWAGDNGNWDGKGQKIRADIFSITMLEDATVNLLLIFFCTGGRCDGRNKNNNDRR